MRIINVKSNLPIFKKKEYFEATTVEELIDVLKSFPLDADVKMGAGGGRIILYYDDEKDTVWVEC